MTRQILGSYTRLLTWFVFAAVAMFASAYSVARWLGVFGTISGWTGLQQHEAEIPMLRTQAENWELLALTLPFLAATLVWTGRKKPVNRNDISGFLFECGVSLLQQSWGPLVFSSAYSGWGF